MDYSENYFNEMISEVEREQKQRRRVYQNLVDRGTMARECANKRYSRMNRVLDFLVSEKKKRFPGLDIFNGNEKGGME